MRGMRGLRGGYGSYAGGYSAGAGFPGRAWSGSADPSLVPPPAGEPNYTDDYFTYVVNPGNIASLAVAQANINIQADSDFEWIESTVSANLHGQAEPWPDNIIIPITLQIVDAGSGRQLFLAATPVTSLAGNGKQPFILPQSRIFMSKSTVNFTFTNFGGSTYDNVFFNLIGRKIFKLGG